MRRSDFGHSDDCIHGGADIVRHVGQKLAFGQIRAFRRLSGRFLCLKNLSCRIGIKHNKGCYNQCGNQEKEGRRNKC